MEGGPGEQGKWDSIKGVSQHGQSCIGEVDPDLVRASRLETAVDLSDDGSFAIGVRDMPFLHFLAMSYR